MGLLPCPSFFKPHCFQVSTHSSFQASFSGITLTLYHIPSLICPTRSGKELLVVLEIYTFPEIVDDNLA